MLARVPGFGTWSFQASWAARRALVKELDHSVPDALFIHTQVAGLLAFDFMRRIPTVISLDATPKNFDMQGLAYGHRQGRRLTERVKGAINRKMFTSAIALVTWCEWAARSLIDDYGISSDRVHVIHPGVDVTMFAPLARTERDGSLKRKVLFVGGNFDRKGGRQLLDAVRSLAGRVELDIATGNSSVIPAGPWRVHRGLAPQSPELVSLYKQADIFVLPTLGDCFPQAIAEAMACGLPVIASDVGAIREMVDEGVTGILLPPGDSDALAIAIAALEDNAQLRRRFGDAGRAVAERHHDARRNIGRLFELLAGLPDPRAQRRAQRIAPGNLGLSQVEIHQPAGSVAKRT